MIFKTFFSTIFSCKKETGERFVRLGFIQIVFLISFSFLHSIILASPQVDGNDIYVIDPIVGIDQSTQEYALAMDHRDNAAAAAALIRMGKFYFLQGDYNLAEDLFSKSLSIYLKLKNGRGITQAIIGQGNVYRKEKKYAQAFNQFHTAEKIAIKWDYENEIGLIYNHIGDIYRHLRNYELAERYYERSLYIAKKRNDSIEIANNYTNLGEIKRLENKLAIARNYYEKALLISRKSDNRFGIVENQHGLACIDTIQGKNEEAMVRLQEARGIAEKRHYREELKNVYALEASMFEKKGDLVQSLKIQKEFNDLNERLYLSSVTLQNTQQRTMNEIEQKNRELFEKSSTISMMSRMQIGLFIALVLLLIGSGFLYFLNTRHSTNKQALANQTLQLKEQVEQIELQQKQLLHTNEINTRLLNLLNTDIRNPIDESIRRIETLMHHPDSTKRLYESCASVVADLQLTNQVIDNLLFWSNKTTHRIQAGFEIVNLRICLSDELFLLESLAKAKSIQLINDLSETQVVYADPQLIQMSIRNLVLDSIKNSTQGSIIKIDAKRINGHVEVRVKQSGKELSSDEIASLFDEKHIFSHASSTQIASGLSHLLVNEVVKKNRGHIHATSESGNGITYHFTLQAI